MPKVISKIQLNVIEKSLDKLFNKVGIDIEFSKHFFDWINDPRNVDQITISELINIYHSLYDKFGVKLSKTSKEVEELIKSLSTDINIPINLSFNRKDNKLEMVAKTIMRKKGFKSSSPVLAVESFKTYLEKQEELEEALITFGGKAYPKFGQVVIQAGGAGCFAGDTFVKTQDGYKQIQDITEEDIVVTFNEETQEIENNKVLKKYAYENHTTPLVELEFESGQKIICTENHEFYVDGKWVEAKDLEI